MASYRALVDIKKCTRCECIDERVLEVHHIDRDRSNNDPGNLEVLCPTCHRLEHLNDKRGGRKSGLTPPRTMVAIRIPDVLQAMIDSAAGEGKRSEWILDACRMRIDGGSSKRPEPEPVMGRNAQKDTSYGAGDANAASTTAMGDSQPRPDMQALRDICAGKHGSDPILDAFIQIGANIEIPICGKDWWEDGEQYECLMDKGHKISKCGQRGMVRTLDVSGRF